MCGINGIFAYHYAANPIDRAELMRTRDRMAARGPDSANAWCSEDERVGLGHRRLSIIDLSDGGLQPMANDDGSLRIVFNGEIYNYRALKNELSAKGHVFRTSSDTEVLLHLYEERGAAMVDALRGMFAFAIWDERRRQLFLARDPYGIKPLYYADDGWTFRFASQVKALIAGGAVRSDLDPAGEVGFYLWGSVPEPFTIHESIRAVPAGATLTVDRLGAAEPRHYHSIADVYRAAEDTPERRATPSVARETIREALLDSVRHHLVADVPVGLFLSAGIDSAALLGLMRDAGQDEIETVTLAFAEFRGRPEDEAPLAAELARLYGARHTVRVVDRAEFEADLPRILDAMDQPSIDGINSWFVAKAARELGLKVALSGLGGDELFGGYPSFVDLPKWVRRAAVPARIPLLGRAVREVARRSGATGRWSPKAAGALEYGGDYAGAYLLRRGLFMPWELAQLLAPEIVERGMRRLAPLALARRALSPSPRTAHGRVATLESALYMRNQLLRDTDWASMAHSLEVRTPLVDPVLLAAIAPYLTAAGRPAGKGDLAAAPRVPLPQGITGRAKTGFTTPIRNWIRQAAFAGSGASSARPERPWARDWALRVAAASIAAPARAGGSGTDRAAA